MSYKLVILKQLCCICYNVDMKYTIAEDIEAVCTLLSLTPSKLAEKLGVARSTVLRILKGETYPSDLFLASFYSFAYQNSMRSIHLNDLKIEFAVDLYDKVLFHGAKSGLEGDIDLYHSRNDIDVGVGFYLGESYDQASSYVFPYRSSSVYLFDAKELSKLKTMEFTVCLEWMLMVSYYRGYIQDYRECALLQQLIEEVEQADVVIAPIADNDMYETMSRFSRGEITDMQAISALSASHLGKQHVLKSERACHSVHIVDRLYLCVEERRDIERRRKEAAQVALDKSTLAIKNLRRQGKYIEEILK